MATNHRGEIVGNPETSHGGHRPTPRLAALMAGIGNMGLEDGQAFLNTYRDNRDMLQEGPDSGDNETWVQKNSQNNQEAGLISDALVNRHGEPEFEYGESGPSAMRFDGTGYTRTGY